MEKTSSLARRSPLSVGSFGSSSGSRSGYGAKHAAVAPPEGRVARAASAAHEVAAARGIRIIEREGCGFASVLLRKGRRDELAQRLRQHFQLELPAGLHRTGAADLAFTAIGPESWLASSDRGGDALLATLRPILEGVGSLSDQSDAYVLLRVSGPGADVREVLSKLLPLDLHPQAFTVNRAARTVAAHMAVLLWRLEDPESDAVFEIAVAHSLAQTFWIELIDAASSAL